MPSHCLEIMGETLIDAIQIIASQLIIYPTYLKLPNGMVVKSDKSVIKLWQGIVIVDITFL
jgi:hypothetical protein